MTWIGGNIFNGIAQEQPFSAEIKRAIKGDKFLNIEYSKNIGDNGGLIKLTTNDNFNYYGGLYYDADKNSHAKINCKLFFNVDNAFIIGDWFQESYVFTVICELEKINKFEN